MRTLNRPMFKMGGPIKEGVMHGIREPYRGGGAALVGNPVYPQTAGREHHNIWLQAGNVAGRGIRAFKNIFGKTGPVTRTVPKQGPTYYPPTGRTLSSKGYPGGKITGTPQGPGSTEVTEQIFKPNWLGKYLGSSPEVGIAKKLYEGKGFITKPIKMAAKSPVLTAAGAYWAGDRWLWGDGSEVSKDEIAKLTEGQHGPFDHTEKKTTKQAQADFAKTQRDTRVNRYLQLMGYDRAKKTAIADALIDASKIVSDRGTLDRKNITGELINPAIQALSKRLDKPDQIREAVGLMMVKGELEKEMYEAKPGTIMKTAQDLFKSGYAKSMDEAIRMATKEPRGVGEALTTFAISNKGSLKDDDISLVIRDYGYKNNVPVDVVTSEQLIERYGKDVTKHPSATKVLTDLGVNEDGIYQIGGEVIEIVDGKPQKRI